MDEKPPIRLDDLIAHVRAMSPGGGPLQHLADAMRVSEYLGDVADHLIGHFVDQARRAGASWTQIGGGMGVTKQAAQKRFVPRETASVFSRFTDRARRVVTDAEEQARLAGNPGVVPAHVVHALARDPDAIAGRCLTALGVSLEEVARAATESFGPGGAGPMEHAPFTPQAKRLLELVTREALRLGHNYVGTEHILLGLLADENPVLTGAGVTHAGAEEWISQELENIKRSRGRR